MKFSISPELIGSCKSSSSKYKNELVEKIKLAEQEAKVKKMDLKAKKNKQRRKRRFNVLRQI